MRLEDIMPNKISQTPTDKYCVVPHLDAFPGVVRSVQTESRRWGPRAGGGELVFNGPRVLVLEDEKVQR